MYVNVTLVLNTTSIVPTGSIYIYSNKDSNGIPVYVYIDGYSKGTSPIIVSNLTIGNHFVKVSTEGYLDWMGWAAVATNQLSYVYANINQTNTTDMGYLRIISSPSNATIYLNYANTGQTTPFTFSKKSGTYVIGLDKLGYNYWSGNATVNSGSTTTVEVVLTSKKQAIVTAKQR